jgi:hypothetical protein
MNRTLKFRVWCEYQSAFEHIDLYKDNFNIGKYVNAEINQFTGLTDSFGNDIYEGDFLEIAGTFEKVLIKYEVDKFVTNAVSKNFVLKKSNLSDYLNLNIFNSKIKIIGNIKENPDLENEKNLNTNNRLPSFVDINSLLDNLTKNKE